MIFARSWSIWSARSAGSEPVNEVVFRPSGTATSPTAKAWVPSASSRPWGESAVRAAAVGAGTSAPLSRIGVAIGSAVSGAAAIDACQSSAGTIVAAPVAPTPPCVG